MENNEKNQTVYFGRYLGSVETPRKRGDDGKLPVGKDGKELSATYGTIAIALFGTRTDNSQPWFTVRNEFTTTERMKELCADIPFDTKAKFVYETGVTPGAKQRLIQIEPVED